VDLAGMAVASGSTGQAELVAVAICLSKLHDMVVLAKYQALGKNS